MERLPTVDAAAFAADTKLLPRYRHFIDGRLVEPASGAYFPTEDPYTRLPAR